MSKDEVTTFCNLSLAETGTAELDATILNNPS